MGRHGPVIVQSTGRILVFSNILSRTVSVIAAYCSNIIQVIFVNKLHYSVIVNCILLFTFVRVYYIVGPYIYIFTFYHLTCTKQM